MIPLRDQELLRQRFQRDLTSRVRIDYFTQRPSSIFVPGRQECAYCEEVQTLLEEVASLSERISLTVHDVEKEESAARSLGIDRVPATVIRGQTNRPLRYFGVPAGLQLVVLVEALLEAAAGPQLAPESVRRLRRLKSDVHLQVLVLPACPYSPAVARTALRFALQSVRVKADIIEVSEFLPMASRYNVRAVPTVIIDEKAALPGSMDESVLLDNVMRVAEGRPFTGETRIGRATPFNPAAAQQQAHQPPQRVSEGGLILPR